MGALHGHKGVVKVGAALVLLTKSWSIEKTVENPENTSQGDADRKYLTGGPVGRSGAITAWYDKTNTTGQGALKVDAEIDLHLMAEGDASGDQDETGPAIVQKVSKSVDMGDVVEITFDWLGNGAWTDGDLA